MQPVAGGPVPEEDQHQRQRQREDDVAAGDLGLQAYETKPIAAVSADERRTDPLELLGAEAEHPVVVRRASAAAATQANGSRRLKAR